MTRRALDPATVEPTYGTRYPEKFAGPAAKREKRVLGEALGLSKVGVNLTRLPPGTSSSQRHWHSQQDEFVFIVSGEAVLVTDAGEQTLTAGMAAGFPAGSGDGHQLVNRSEGDVVLLEMSDRTPGDEVDYPDVDLLKRYIDGEARYVRKDGTPY